MRVGKDLYRYEDNGNATDLKHSGQILIRRPSNYIIPYIFSQHEFYNEDTEWFTSVSLIFEKKIGNLANAYPMFSCS